MLITGIILIIFILAFVIMKSRYEKWMCKNIALIIATIVFMALLFALDRTSKVEISAFLGENGTGELIPGIIGLHLHGNTGAAWGIFSGNTWILTGFSSVVVVAAFYFMFVKKFYSFLVHLSVALVTAGGIGNLFDRIVYGSVTDFFEFMFIEFPIFNVADCCITIGAVLLIASVVFSKKDDPIFVKSKDENKPPDEQAEASE